MAQQTINVGAAANDTTGDPLRDSFIKVNANFTELYGASYQPLDATLTALAGVAATVDQLPYFNGTNTATVTPFTATARGLLDDTTTAAMLTTLGAAPTVSPTFTGTPIAPTATAGTNTTQIATTAFVAAAAKTQTTIQKFTASGTYTAPATMTWALVYCKAGGGSGGGSNVTQKAGGSGGEGAEGWVVRSRAALTGQTVTVGAGGTGIAANSTTSGNNGGDSSVGTIVTAGGGKGGTSHNGQGFAGLKGNIGTCDWGMSGQPGNGGQLLGAAASASPPSGGGKGGGGWGDANGVPNSGGGGMGGYDTSVASGAGGSGIVVFIEFYT